MEQKAGVVAHLNACLVCTNTQSLQILVYACNSSTEEMEAGD